MPRVRLTKHLRMGDGGRTWEEREQGLIADYLPDPHGGYGHDPHYLALCPTQPDVKVKFGFPIVVDHGNPDMPGSYLGISEDQRMGGGALSVGPTEDGGQTWTALRNGLPQTHCYDIVLRHTLALNRDQLAFGATTGNTFLSNDRGDA